MSEEEIIDDLVKAARRQLHAEMDTPETLELADALRRYYKTLLDPAPGIGPVIVQALAAYYEPKQ